MTCPGCDQPVTFGIQCPCRRPDPQPRCRCGHPFHGLPHYPRITGCDCPGWTDEETANA